MESPHIVFVYGTLRQGESNHHYLRESEYLGRFETTSDYALYDLGEYPGLIKGHQTVVGEVYRITAEVLNQLDILEDIPNEYRREKIDTPYGSAWIYLYQQSIQHDEEIVSGDWCQRV
ncbi:gamma-glutamylcyclotransferase family protein [Vibrio maerlii]|uniref:gamma-glutamylcyclotransferase family protein n=1 Tax=Vibrio maerlii TaxID=2231648 RepID=UPI000E3E4FCF|nr:gamma-glutamylcyclotransferase [Vibrio maerlii]